MFIIEKTENTEAFLLSPKSIILILISQICLLLIPSRHFYVCVYFYLFMYVYIFKNGIVLYRLLCTLFFFFHLAYWEHPVIVLK